MINDAQKNQIFIGDGAQKPPAALPSGAFVTLNGERFYKISNLDALEPFFISLVSSSDHWLFIASTGGLTAGRVSAEQALFPYYTVDRITENNENTGNVAVLRVTRQGQVLFVGALLGTAAGDLPGGAQPVQEHRRDDADL